VIDPNPGAPQADIFHYYKMSLIRATAWDRAIRAEERRARREHRSINPENIQVLYERLARQLPYKSHGCRYHSFVVYFSQLRRLGWVEESGVVELSSFQSNYSEGQPRRFYRLTAAGLSAPESAWANPQRALFLF
jgi:hypothetical protein